MPVVDITFRGNDQASKSLEAIRGQLADMQKKTSQLSDEQRRAAQSAQAMQDAQNRLHMSLTDLKSGIDMAVGGIKTLARGTEEVVKFGREGANLEYAQQKFDRLAVSIGATSGALMGQLRTATRGLVADSTLVSGAGDLMSLGLAKTSDQVVRLTRVAGALNMPMNQLVLALSNQTTARFDQLNVSVDGFDERLQKLKATGMDTNAAFTEAFLQQAEAQLAKIGDKADSATAAYDRLDVAIKNAGDALKKAAAPGITADIEVVTQNINDLTTGEKNLFQVLADNQKVYAMQAERMKNAGTSLYEYTAGERAARQAAKAGTSAIEEQEQATRSASWQMDLYRKNTDEYRTTMMRTAQEDEAASKQMEEAKKQAIATGKQYYQEMQDAAARAKQAQDDFNASFGAKAASALQKYTGEGKKYREGLEIQDRVLGTNATAAYDAQKALDELSRKFATGQIDAATYAKGLEDQKPAWAALDENLQKAKKGLEDAQNQFHNFMASLAEANGFRATVYVETVTTGGGSTKNPTTTTSSTGTKGYRDPGTGSGYGGVGGANGLHLVVPPHYPNDTFGPIWASSNERVDITPAGKAGGGGGFTIYGGLHLHGVQNVAQLQAELGRRARMAAASGAWSQGG